MAQIFKRSTNMVAKTSIYGAVFLIAGLVWVFMLLDRSSYNTGQGVTLAQPVPFSHAHHVSGLGIDCRYCHTAVEESAYAGVPPTATCINCHKLIWNESPMLEPVRASYARGEPIAWSKVHDLPDFVYFNHSIHVAKGIGCDSCHGRIDQMKLVYQNASLQMEWCLECHRRPEAFVRPREEIFNPEWEAEDQESLGRRLVEEYGVQSKIYCSTCHR
jgi:hypothetical protein